MIDIDTSRLIFLPEEELLARMHKVLHDPSEVDISQEIQRRLSPYFTDEEKKILGYHI